MYFFIFHLSVADLVVAFFNIFPQMVWDITWRFQGNDVGCKTVKFLQVFALYLSTWVLVMMVRREISYLTVLLKIYSKFLIVFAGNRQVGLTFWHNCSFSTYRKLYCLFRYIQTL